MHRRFDGDFKRGLSPVTHATLQFITGIPELVTGLPQRGERRNHDLALIGNTDDEQVTITIEAKADEPFGNDTILEYWSKAIQRKEKGKPTRVPERIEQLLSMVDPHVPVKKSRWKDVRYQLLTALCGTILQAQNHHNLELFLSVLAGKTMTVEAGKMYNDFNINGIDLMVGKVVTILRKKENL